MSTDFRMPSLGPDMESGTLVEWRVKPGDAVARGDIVALVETDKGVIDVETFASGVVETLVVPQGARVPVGTVLARFSGESANVAAPAGAPPAPEIAQPSVSPASAHVPVTPSEQPHGTVQRQKVSPAARAHARALGIDLANVRGSGAGGVVTVDDVDSYAKAAAGAKSPAAAPKASDMRQVIARAMSKSKREIPHYYLSLTCSFQAAHEWLERHNAAVSIDQRLLPSALLLKAVALAARAVPEFNGFYQDSAFVPAGDVHVGMAIAMRGGRLVAPAILNADGKPLATVMSELRDLTARVRSGHMRASELALSTITLTSLGDEGVELILPVIYPPQVAIVGAGSILEKPWVVDGAVRPVHVLTLTLAADHRVSDGRAGTRFLGQVRDALQSPEAL